MEVVHQLQQKKYLTSCNGRRIWPAKMEEVVDQLQWKKMLTYAMEEVVHLLIWKK